jgi:hypothetical protein
MKKFFTFLLCLILVFGAAAAFFFGWVNYAVPAGSYGIIRSKSHGVDAKLVQEGEFRWIWYKLVPKNVTIVVFSPKTIDRSWESTGILPQGDAYIKFSGLDADFSWLIRGNLSFNIKPDELPPLLETKNLGSQEALDAFSDRTAGEIIAFAQNFLQREIENAAETGAVLNARLEQMLRASVSAQYPYVENLFLPCNIVKAPGLGLYTLARSVYTAYLERQKNQLEEAASVLADIRLQNQAELDRLERYGELLTKYPVLVNTLSELQSLP